MNLTFIDPGQLTARLDLESAIETPDGQGGVTLSHAAESSLWARIEPLSAAREELGHVGRQVVTHRIWVRHSDAVDTRKRFRKGTRIFEIVTVQDPDESGRYLVCQAREA
jgi:SPP1 family predicted phage head-tail adaptor